MGFSTPRKSLLEGQDSISRTSSPREMSFSLSPFLRTSFVFLLFLAISPGWAVQFEENTSDNPFITYSYNTTADTPNTTATHAGAVSTAVTSSIGTEVVDEIGCSNTEFRLTCRELDSTIAILDARFYPFDGLGITEPIPVSKTTKGQSTESSPLNETVLPDTSPTEHSLPCPASKEWLQAPPWARTVSPDGAAVVDPSSENESYPWPIQPNSGEYHFRLALNHRCSGVNHCSFILSSDFEEAGLLWGPGAVRIRYACMRQGHHLVRYCNEDIVAGAAPSMRDSGSLWQKKERRRRGRMGVGGGAKGEGVKGGEEKGEDTGGGEEEEEGGGWPEGEGYVASPGYPKYYVGGRVTTGGQGSKGGCEWVIRPRQPGQRVQVTLLDVSLRGVGPLEQECSDWVEITAMPEGKRISGAFEDNEERLLLIGCGEAPEAVRIESPEEAPGLRIALRSTSGTLFTKRGILFHYKALGCRWPPPSPPKDGYLVARNVSVAQYMCCVGFKFPDTGRRERELYCDEQRGLWRVRELHEGTPSRLLPDCIDGDTSLLRGNGSRLNENSTVSEKASMLKEADLVLDVLVPAIIIGILLFGNGIILYIIFQFKKRKQTTEVQEEELRISQNGPENNTGRPSDV